MSSRGQEERKQTMLTEKIKRTVIESGDQLEVEFATLSAWFRGKKVAGGGPGGLMSVPWSTCWEKS